MKRRILLGLTGSVASILYLKLIEELQQHGIVDVILTERAKHFVKGDLWTAVESVGGKVYREEDEWKWKCSDPTPGFPDRCFYDSTWKKEDPVLHINLRDHSSALVIAPCSLNTLAKISNGICDNLLTSVARAWDFNRPMILAPAGNTFMWEHPTTAEHLTKFVNFSYNNKYVVPQKKMLACGTYGMGAMGDIHLIGNAVKDSLKWSFPISRNLANMNVCEGIPVGNHPGAFAAKRKNSTHTGVDLYVDEDTRVVPVEDGVVVGIEPFTGPKDNSPWWLDTDCVLVEGASGVVCYGEIKPNPDLMIGYKVMKNSSNIGKVKRVIPPDKPQHPEIEGWKPSMLHIELYPHGVYKPSDGYGESVSYLQDPTSYLLEATNAPSKVFRKE